MSTVTHLTRARKPRPQKSTLPPLFYAAVDDAYASWARTSYENNAWVLIRGHMLAGLQIGLTYPEWQKTLEYFDHRCAYCGCGDIVLNFDHVVATTRGGGFTANNILPSCKACNSTKRDKTIEEWVGVVNLSPDGYERLRRWLHEQGVLDKSLVSRKIKDSRQAAALVSTRLLDL